MFRDSSLLILLFLFAFIAGCSEKGTEPSETKKNVLLPLSIANQWNYILYSSVSDSIGQVNWNIEADTTIQGKEYFLIKVSGFISDFYYLARNETDGLYLSVDSIFASHEKQYFYFKYPAEDNEVYQFTFPDTDSTITVKVKKYSLTVKNKNYDCYGYINENVNPYFPFMYFSVNKGLIRSKAVFMWNGGIDTSSYFIYDLQNMFIQE